jgi:hypothetical protein
LAIAFDGDWIVSSHLTLYHVICGTHLPTLILSNILAICWGWPEFWGTKVKTQRKFTPVSLLENWPGL